MTATLGVDLGGTKVASGVWDGQHVTCRVELPTRTDALSDPGLLQTLAAIDMALAAAATQGLHPSAIGLGVPEYVSPAGLLTSHEVIGWHEQPVDLIRSRQPGLGIVVDSDVRCAAVAEARVGAGKDASSLLFVTVGTGISSCLVVAGQPWVGARGEAIALGEFPASARGVDGTVEGLCSGRAMDEAFTQLTAGDASPGAAARAYQLGEPAAVAIVNDAISGIARAISAAVSIFDPALVVVGGGLPSHLPAFYEGLSVAVSALLTRRPHPPKLALASLAADAGLIGAAIVAADGGASLAT